MTDTNKTPGLLTEYVVEWTNAHGEKIVREFTTAQKAGSYCLALKESGHEYTVTKILGATFTNWAQGVVNG